MMCLLKTVIDEIVYNLLNTFSYGFIVTYISIVFVWLYFNAITGGLNIYVDVIIDYFILNWM